jgi:hypothetical protein
VQPFQFRLRSLFILTALVAVGCLVGPPIVREVRVRFWPPDVEITLPDLEGTMNPPGGLLPAD